MKLHAHLLNSLAVAAVTIENNEFAEAVTIQTITHLGKEHDQSIGAVLASKKVADTMGPGSHGSTFGGNPVVCAGGCAVLDAMDDAFMRNVNARAAQLREGLASLPHVASVSGMGLMVGIAFADDVKAADVRAACERKGLLVLTAKTRLRLLPPLILSEADVAKALAILDDVLSSM